MMAGRVLTKSKKASLESYIRFPCVHQGLWHSYTMLGCLSLEGFLGNLVAYVHLKDSYVCCALLDFGMEFVSFCDLETKNAFFEIGKTNLVDVVFRPCT